MRYSLFQFKTLQSRLVVLLLLPISLIIFSGGLISFIYTRNLILEQWNESAVLKLQRAAHYLEMRLLKPVEMMEMLFQLSGDENIPITPLAVAEHLETLEGVMDVRFTAAPGFGVFPVNPKKNMKARRGMMHFRHSRISGISEPVYDADAGHETVTLALSLTEQNGSDMGRIEIKMSLHYLLRDILQLGWWQSDMACIVDQAGKYMAHTNMDMKGRHHLGGQDDPLEQAILEALGRMPSGTVKSSGRPPKMVAGFYRLEQIPWTVILFAKGDYLLKPIIQYRNVFALGSIVLICLILVLIRHHVGEIVRNIKILSKSAGEVALGKYGPPIETDGRDEIGQLVDSYNDMVRGLKERDFIRDSFGRYVDPEVAKHLMNNPHAGELGGQRREVVLMMSDIRGFTSLSETLSPEIIIRILNQYFSHMIRIIQDHNGIIVDFFGDSILVFFEPITGSIEDKVFCCIQCAARMQSEMRLFNKRMREQGMPQLGMGIGINSGQVIVGNIGSESRTKYGVVGSAVNITSRIQAKAKKDETIISESVYQYVKDHILINRSFDAELKGVEGKATLRVMENIIR